MPSSMATVQAMQMGFCLSKMHCIVGLGLTLLTQLGPTRYSSLACVVPSSPGGGAPPPLAVTAYSTPAGPCTLSSTGLRPYSTGSHHPLLSRQRRCSFQTIASACSSTACAPPPPSVRLAEGEASSARAQSRRCARRRSLQHTIFASRTGTTGRAATATSERMGRTTQRRGSARLGDRVELATTTSHTTTATDGSRRRRERKDGCHNLGGGDDNIGSTGSSS